jgi:hypothetical protein
MSNDRVFILGAGASKYVTLQSEINMPLAREFFQSKYINEFWSANHIFKSSFANSELLQFLIHYFSVTHKNNFFTTTVTAKENYTRKQYDSYIESSINIEEVFSFIEFIEQGFYDLEDREFVRKSKFQLLEYLFNVLKYMIEDGYDETLYKKIINSLDKGDTIITYNWDLLLDNTLLNQKKGKELLENLKGLINPFDTFNINDYDKVAYKDFHKGYYLKQHGSINWACCTNKECVRNSVPFVFDPTSDIYIDLWHCNYCGSLLELMLLPPHVHKTYKYNRFFSLQAKIALDKMRTARELVIIGYSFPEFDFETNSLFRKSRMSVAESKNRTTSWLKNIVIVNPEVYSQVYLNKVIDLFGLKNSKRYYGNKVELIKFDNVDEFIREYKLIKREKNIEGF